jgi:hypothetical protein
MQILIGDMLQKLDPNGKIQTNDLDAWVQERLTPAVARRTTAPEHAPRVDLFDLDDRKPPAHPNGDAAAFNSPEEIHEFNAKWERVERMIQSVSGTENASASLEATPKRTNVDPDETTKSAAQDKTEPPEQTFTYDELKKSAGKQLGAIRVAPAGRTPTNSTPDSDDEPKEEEPDISTPVIAHVVKENHDLELRKLNEAVADLQKKQTIVEATVQRAEPVNEVDGDNDEENELSFLELYGDAILMSCVAFGFGIFVGLRMRRGGT